MRRIVSTEPEILNFIAKLRMKKLTEAPKIPQLTTDATWLNIVAKWKRVAKKVRGRTLLSAVLRSLPEDMAIRKLLISLGAKA